jgi:hypothetical protein
VFLAEQSLDPERASQHIGLLCWEISRSTIAPATAGAFGFLTFTQCAERSIFGLATSDWCDKLVQQVGGQAHETQCIRFVWSGGGAAYRNGGADGFSRDAFRRRCWQLEVLQHRWN